MGAYSKFVNSDKEAIDTIWVVVATAMIFFMQTGFTLIENGSVRQKNSNAILIKNMFDTLYGAIGFWLVGFGIVVGDHGDTRFIGL